MIKILKTYSFLWILLTASIVSSQNTDAIFKIGNDHYAQGRYQEAIDAYKRVLDLNQESAALYYNLANANYKLNNIGPTVFYYEKALQLHPSDSQIRNNAAFAENMKIDVIETMPVNAVKRWANKVITFLTADGWAIAAILFVVLFVLSFLGYYFGYGTARKRTFFTLASLSLLLMIASVSFAYSAFAKANNDNPAIVFASETEVKSEPSLGSTLVFKLHEGTKVQVLEEVNNWNRIQLIDGKTGWLPSEDIKLLNNF